MIREHSVQLLGHGPVEGAHAGLDVRNRHVALGPRQGAGERGVRVAVDQDEIRLDLRELGLERLEHPRRLRAERSAADPELPVGRRDPELLEEDP